MILVVPGVGLDVCNLQWRHTCTDMAAGSLLLSYLYCHLFKIKENHFVIKGITSYSGSIVKETVRDVGLLNSVIISCHTHIVYIIIIIYIRYSK